MTFRAKRAYSGLVNASAASSRRGDLAALPSLRCRGTGVNVSQIPRSVREIASASGRAAPVAVMAAGSRLGASPVSQRPFRRPAGAHRRGQWIARVSRDAEPGEQQEAEPADIVDQRRTPVEARPATAQQAGEMVQLAQPCCAFEGLGVEPAFRSAFVGAKACCRRQSVDQRLVQQGGPGRAR